MNAQPSILTSDFRCQSYDIFSLLGEPDDPSTKWNELRYARFSGVDHIFFSSRINSELASKDALEEFLLDIYQILQTNSNVSKIFLYKEKLHFKPDFFHFNVNWKGNTLRDFRIEAIQSTRHKKFIRDLFEQSLFVADETAA